MYIYKDGLLTIKYLFVVLITTNDFDLMNIEILKSGKTQYACVYRHNYFIIMYNIHLFIP